MNPSARYRELANQPGFVADAAQTEAVERLDNLYASLREKPRPGSIWQRLVGSKTRPAAARGIYFWGGVGRGKTLLMDLFFQSLPQELGQRVHFHSFMNRVHADLRQLQDTPNPLHRVALDIARDCRVLCLDEFVIIDIGDAMIMAGLLQALFAEGVVLVTTSNAAPRDLYRDGLQRARFVPAIDLIEQHCEVVNLDGGQDYRLRFLRQTELYSVPHDQQAEASMRRYLDEHVIGMQQEPAELNVNGRMLMARFCGEDTVWFDFAELCETARSQHDYLELARCYTTLILSDIRQLERVDDDVARRFVLLIDVLYDHRVKLICSAAVAPDELYLGQRLRFEFERTSSRLLEMQSDEYLAQAHTQQ